MRKKTARRNRERCQTVASSNANASGFHPLPAAATAQTDTGSREDSRSALSRVALGSEPPDVSATMRAGGIFSVGPSSLQSSGCLPSDAIESEQQGASR